MKSIMLKNKKKSVVLLIIILVIFFSIVYPTLYIGLVNDAVRNNDYSRVKTLLIIPGNINFHWHFADMYGDTPLQLASMNNNTEMMALLLQNGANASTRSGSRQPIEYVFSSNVYEGLFERTKLLVDHGADLSRTGNSYFPIVSKLLTRSNYGLDEKQLQEANAEVLKTLTFIVKHGASVEAADPRARYLTSVVEDENYGVLEFLFSECGVDVNEQDILGETALMRASKLGNLKMVNFLLSFNADILLRDEEGNMAINYARKGRFTDIVERLE